MAERWGPYYLVIVRAALGYLAWLPYHFGAQLRDQIAEAGSPDAEGWITLTLPFDALEDAHGRIPGFGRAMEVLSARALRNAVLDYATQIVSLYMR